MLALAFIIWMLPMDHWYDGPLSERMINIPERSWSTWRFRPVGPDADKIRRLHTRLQGSPIFVLAPDSPYAGYGLQAGQGGWIALIQFNWLVQDAVRSTGGTDYEHSPGVIPARHEALAWGLAALRSMGIEPDIDWEPGFPEHSRRWETQIAHDAKEAQVYDPAVVRLALERLGAEVPPDLAMVPLPPPPREAPKPKTKAEMRAIFQQYGLPIPPQYVEDAGE